MGYVEGFIIPVPEDKKQAYIDLARIAAPIFLEHGATRVVECWGDDLMQGKINDFYTAAHAEEGENIVFSWIEYPSREVRDAAHQKVFADERMQPQDGQDMPFDGKRMIYSGFSPILDTASELTS